MAPESRALTAPPTGRAHLSNDELNGQLAAARARLQPKLAAVDLAGIGLSAYNQRYLRHKLAVLESELRQVSDLLRLCVSGTSVPLRDVTILDYGGGSGVISLLAKELGIGTVIYNDIYDVSCADVGLLADAINLQLDHIVCGDIDDVLTHLRAGRLELNAVVSYDVLEHIYDIPAFFRELATAPRAASDFRLVMASGANIKNRHYVRYATNVQLTDELRGTEPEWGHKDRDAVRPFLEIRRELIRASAPQLDSAQVDKLARATRGLRQDEIDRAVAEYVETGSISYRLDHPTNTCDPYTGNWSEHLMDPDWLEKVLHDAGFAARVRPGLYAPVGNGLRPTVKRVLNVAIRLTGRRALALAPYYVVYAG